MTTTDLAIDLTRVAKTYRGKVRALQDVSMQVRRGEIFGLLGPNGAGKSTLVKILMTIVHPTRCEGSLLGYPVGRKATLGRVGYLPEHLRFPDYLTGEQTLDSLAALAKVPRAVRRKRAGEMLELVGMTRWRSKKIGGYSKGMKQRLGVAQTLMNDPDLILLDEPTDGVDPVGRRDIRVVMQELKRRGKTVFINSHLLGEVELICDRVVMLVQGQAVRQGTLDELTGGRQRYEIEIEPTTSAPDWVTILQGAVTMSRGQAAPTPPAAGAAQSGRLKNGETAECDGFTVRIHTIDARTVQPAIDAIRASNHVIRGVKLIRPTLEALFIEAVTDPETGKARDVGAAANRKEAR